MAAKPVVIGDQYFSRQIDALNFFKEILSKYSLGERVSVADTKSLIPLLDRHRHREEKVGSGVDYFIVDADGYGKQCFWVVRTDGTRVQFTYRRCITGIW